MKSAKYAAAGLMAVALAIGLLGTYRHVFAQEESRQGNPPGAVLASPAETSSDPATNQVLERNYLVHGTRSGTSFPSEYTAVDPVKTVECPGASIRPTLVMGATTRQTHLRMVLSSKVLG